MSSSRTLSRGVVTIEGSADFDASVGPLEALFDELEQAGHRFVSPADPGFEPAARAVVQRGQETFWVTVLCTPALTRAQTLDLAHRVAAVLRGEVDTDPGEEPARRPPDEVPTKSHVGPASRRRDEVPTRPEGVISVRPARKAHEEEEEVTLPRARDELPTRPEGVLVIRRPDKK